MKALLAWAQYMFATNNKDAVIGSFTEYVMEAWMQHVDGIASEKKQADEAAQLEPLRSLLDWQAWEEGLKVIVNKYSSTNVKPEEGVRLDYLMRAYDVVTPTMALSTVCDSIDECDTATIIMDEVEFKKDNSRLFDLFRAALKGTPAEPFMKGYFRGAYLAVKQQAEVQSARTSRLSKACAILNNSLFTGKGKYTLLQYTLKMVKAHNELDDLKRPMSETKKVSNFMKGITNPRLGVRKTVVNGDNHKLSNFEACHQYFATLIVNGSTHDQHENNNRNRNISKAEKKQKIACMECGKGGKGTFKGKLHGDYYPPAVYCTMPLDQKSMVRAMREQNDSGKEKKRKAAALKKSALEDSKSDDDIVESFHDR